MVTDGAVGVRVDLHEELLELLLVHALAEHAAEGLGELVDLQRTALVSVGRLEKLPQLHDVLQVNFVAGILLPRIFVRV